MALHYRFKAPYGAAYTFDLGFEDGATADELYIGTDFAAGDVKISKDGGALASATNLPAQVTGSQPGYTLTLTAAEMQASRVAVYMRDASAAAWRGVVVNIITREAYASLVIDATAIGGNVSAVTYQGVGTGHGLVVVGGPTGGQGLAAQGGLNGSGISATAGAGNATGFLGLGTGTGQGIQGTGGPTGSGIAGAGGATSGAGILGTAQAGNSNGISGIGFGNGHGLAGTAGAGGKVCNLFDTIQGGEPTTKPSSTYTYGQILQAVQRRFYNKMTQTTSTQIQYRDDGVTVLTQMAVSDDGVTQTKGAAT